MTFQKKSTLSGFPGQQPSVARHEKKIRAFFLQKTNARFYFRRRFRITVNFPFNFNTGSIYFII